jgi:hypothetical protein
MKIDDLKKGILELLNTHNSVYSSNIRIPGRPLGNKFHKFNLLGKKSFGGGGDLERHLHLSFTDQDRSLASRAFDELRRDGYIEPTYEDMVDPENWVSITDMGRDWLSNSLRDFIDECLINISVQLPEFRRGMHDAIQRASPDSFRQAAHSARELIDQTLKLGAPDLETRKQRAVALMEKFRRQKSKSDVEIIEVNCDLIEAEHNKLVKLAHSRTSVTRSDVEGSIVSAERILVLLFGSKPQ